MSDVKHAIMTDATGQAIVQALSRSYNGTSDERPSSPHMGMIYFDTSLQKLLVYNGSSWITANGDPA